jgi:hypothetical protein
MVTATAQTETAIIIENSAADERGWNADKTPWRPLVEPVNPSSAFKVSAGFDATFPLQKKRVSFFICVSSASICGLKTIYV